MRCTGLRAYGLCKDYSTLRNFSLEKNDRGVFGKDVFKSSQSLFLYSMHLQVGQVEKCSKSEHLKQ